MQAVPPMMGQSVRCFYTLYSPDNDKKRRRYGKNHGASKGRPVVFRLFFFPRYFFRRLSQRIASFVPMVCSTCTSSTSRITATSITRYL